MIALIYGIIALSATILGTISGLGGGVIVKPLFDAVGFHSTAEISFYSSVSVFTMSAVSMIKQIRGGFKFNYRKIAYISAGSIIGGILGEIIFEEAEVLFKDGNVKVIQSIIFAAILVCVLIYTLNKSKIKQYKFRSFFAIFSTGLLLGAVSVFLGIGGGPLNTAVLMLFFSCDMKESAIYSLVMIFFSQFSKLLSVFIEGKQATYDMSLVPMICTISVIGGFVGTIINQKMENKMIQKIYIYIITGLLFLSIYNIFV